MSKKTAVPDTNDATTIDAAPAPTAPPDAAPMAGGLGDLDKVRNILFGAESQQIQQRFSQLEARLERDFGALKDTIEQRFKELEASLHKTNDALVRRLENEKSKRGEVSKTLDKEIKTVAKTLDKERQHLTTEIEKTAQALQEKLEAQASSASSALGARFDELTQRLEAAVGELRHAKTDRHGLAELLAELSDRLRQDD